MDKEVGEYMYKGIVMEVKKDYVIVMKDDGTMNSIKNKDNLKLGDSIFFFDEDICSLEKKSDKIPRAKWMVPLGLVAALIIFIFTPLIKNISPGISDSYALVTFDVNPSVEFMLNSKGKIIKANGLNDDGSALDLKALEGMNVTEGVNTLKTLFSEGNYLINNNSVLVGFSFTGNEDDIEFENLVQDAVKRTFDTYNIAYLKGTDADIKAAESLGISLGKYEAELELDDDLLEEAIENLSVDQIIELLRTKPDIIFWDDDIIDELEDELEDRLEDNKKNDDDDDDHDDDNDEHDEDKED